MIWIIIRSLKCMKVNLIKERNLGKEYYMEENLSLLIMMEIGRMTNNIKKQQNKNKRFKYKIRKQECRGKNY